MVAPVAPPGWPREVRPPDTPDWEVTAAAWLLDLCPPDYRGYTGLRRHVVELTAIRETVQESGPLLDDRGVE